MHKLTILKNASKNEQAHDIHQAIKKKKKKKGGCKIEKSSKTLLWIQAS